MKQRVHIRWAIRRDMKEIEQIEQYSFEYPWTTEDFIRCMRGRNTIAMVAEIRATKAWEIAGFMIYDLHKNRLQLLNFAVAPKYRRLGVGQQLVEKLIGKLSSQRRTRIALEVRETNVAAQYFFRKQGFRAVNVLRDYYVDSPEDAYVMVYRHEPAVQATYPAEKQGGQPR